MKYILTTDSEYKKGMLTFLSELSEKERESLFLISFLDFKRKMIMEKKIPLNVHDVITTLDEETKIEYIVLCEVLVMLAETLPEVYDSVLNTMERMKQNLSALETMFHHQSFMRFVNFGVAESIHKIDTHLAIYEHTGCLDLQGIKIIPNICSPDFINAQLEKMNDIRKMLVQISDSADNSPKSEVTPLGVNTDTPAKKKIKFLGTPAQLAQLFHAFSVKNWIVLDRSGEGTAKILLDFIDFDNNKPSVDSLGKKFQALNKDTNAINNEDATLFLKIPGRNELKR